MSIYLDKQQEPVVKAQSTSGWWVRPNRFAGLRRWANTAIVRRDSAFRNPGLNMRDAVRCRVCAFASFTKKFGWAAGLKATRVGVETYPGGK